MADKKKLYRFLWVFIRDRFNLNTDKASDEETLEYIRKNIEFKGHNLWILIFAVLICSIGLNVNSTAVVIGAMLISPLMGPILGIGTGVAVNDPDLLRRAFKNLVIASAFSVFASALYFYITPITVAQTELLARTHPTLWDVLIAFFGGLTGIVAGTRKEKSTAIPGVAIATALMPPLCTAGYGLATGHISFFLGAFYLFFINSIFISVATFLIVRLLRFPKKEFIDAERERIVKIGIAVFVVLTLLPSIWLAYQTVDRVIFEQKALQFIENEIQFPNTRIIEQTISNQRNKRKIELVVFGDPIPEKIMQHVQSRLEHYKLENTELQVLQINQPDMLSTRKYSDKTDELLLRYQSLVDTKEAELKKLETELAETRKISAIPFEITPELKALFPEITSFSLNRHLVVRTDSLVADTVFLAFVTYRTKLRQRDKEKLTNWLQARLNSPHLKVIEE